MAKKRNKTSHTKKKSSQTQDYLYIKGAREHNLRDLELKIPKNTICVITGLSGSGKSSLAFDTIYAEGRRRYVESLSAYARQFLEQLQKPDVDYIEGLSPAISIEQRRHSPNPRSTVGTITEIYDYLRLLYSKVGRVHCYKCGREISTQSLDVITDSVLKLDKGTKIVILAPKIEGKKGEHKQALEDLIKEGFVRARIDNEIVSLRDTIKLDKNKKHTIEAVIDRLIVSSEIRSRLSESIETALNSSGGIMRLYLPDTKKDMFFSTLSACPECGISYQELSPRAFSFNSPYGACSACNGLGTKVEIDPELVIPDKNLTLRDNAIEPWRRGGRGYIMYYKRLLREVAEWFDINFDKPYKKLSKKEKDIILYGSTEFKHWSNRGYEGVIPHLERLFKTTDSEFLKAHINKFMSTHPCPKCKGARLKPEVLAVTINDKNINEVCLLPIEKALEFFNNLKLTKTEEVLSYQILKEIRERLGFLENVGLSYLTLERKANTLSGGEAQRIRLATQIGSRLTGVLYVLDEPSIGLHQRDNDKLLNTLKSLKELKNTLLVVEHDEATIRSADYIVDLGPGAGRHGGEVVAAGTIKDILKSKKSLTAKYLNRERQIKIPAQRRDYKKSRTLEVVGAAEHNLKEIDVKFPLGLFTCITGVSGSGKSTLIDEVLYRSLAVHFHRSRLTPGRHKKIKGIDNIDKVIVIDQEPIGRTPRSNPATYIGAFDGIRKLFSQLPEAKARGYKPGRFSFNVPGGRCEHCKGDGIIKVEMHFLPDVYVPCEVCKGARFSKETLEVKYKGHSISDVLEMKVEDALSLFENIPAVKNKLQTLFDVGLGYIQMGQSATTLSGGEAQRVKLASELSKRQTGKTLYILDEPTTGLHFADIDKLLNILHRLTSKGNTVIVIEHNLDVIKTADYIIDLGPEGGDKGGKVVASGTPEEVAKKKSSYTGQYLKKLL
jgi:excinuclease ABC subunit A